MKNIIIGRTEEIKILQSLLSSDSPEFLAIYGRRRVGKTFLIKQFFQNKKAKFFSITGEKNASMREQIAHFTKQISYVFYNDVDLQPKKNWDETFELLTKSIQLLNSKEKIILFFDEFPWMVTQHSRLLQNLDYYWNQHWSNDNRIKLIICGSSASWIIDNIVNNKGGLHNRLTRNVLLEPYNLADTKRYLESEKILLNNKQVIELYMAMGGVPYYLNQIERGCSATQVIEKLAFTRKGFLLEEFDKLFSSLFKNSEAYIDIVKIIAAHRYGIGKSALFSQLDKKHFGKSGVEKLKALKDAGFIMEFKPHFHKDKGNYFKLIDYYTLFYLHWIMPVRDTLLKKSLVRGYWDKLKVKNAWNIWAGLAFEAICYDHLPQIVRALSLSPTAIPDSWRYVPRKKDGKEGAQIDLLFDRDDNSITICEIKYNDKPFVITKDYANKLRKKIDIFKMVTRTNKQIFIAMITANGVKENQYSKDLIVTTVTLDDLFK